MFEGMAHFIFKEREGGCWAFTKKKSKLEKLIHNEPKKKKIEQVK